MSKRPTADFVSILTESGVPTSESTMEVQLKSEVSDAGSTLSNDSGMSPFWRWVRSAVITPSVWLIRTLLAGHVMPNMYVATAARWALELKAWEVDVTPKGAERTQGVITLTKRRADEAVTVAAGAVIQTLPIDGTVYKVRVREDTVIEAGILVGHVPVEAEEAGKAYNLPAGYFNIMPIEVSGIVAAVNDNDWITKLGADAESDEELALRIQSAFTSAGNWHIDDVYRTLIGAIAGIRIDNIFFENTGHIRPGTANAYILMDVGETPQSIIDQLNQQIMEKGFHGHGDVLTCVAIGDALHQIEAEIVFVQNLSEQQKVNVMDDVEGRIRAAFRETAAYPEITRASPKSRFSISQLATEIHNHLVEVDSVRIAVDGEVQKDIVSDLSQPRLASLVVRELSDG
ncbi:baseplate J/gp47 family protein [Vibrio fluvialis]|nr:baseplate J/gp47 family protein [Vibrio fluvialis]MBY7939682.1 baseplate J/gp47 family protein [Vibrio fluvialis]MBY8167140.1 baseplate J/gp47 family protein [Vibrio fluvialis]